MNLNLKRPLLFFDTEATSVDPARIIEFAMVKIYPNGDREEKCRKINPGMLIPPPSTAIHGITDYDVKDCPTFGQMASSILAFIDDSDLAGYNILSFDVPLLFNEFARAGIYFPYKKRRIIDACNIFKIKETRTLTAAVKFFCNKELEGAHSALHDTNATIEVFESQLARYEDLPDTIEELALYSNYGKPILDISGKFTTDGDGNIIINFSKLRGEKAKDNPDFLMWMLRSDFSQDTKEVAEQVLDENFI